MKRQSKSARRPSSTCPISVEVCEDRTLPAAWPWTPAGLMGLPDNAAEARQADVERPALVRPAHEFVGPVAPRHQENNILSHPLAIQNGSENKHDFGSNSNRRDHEVGSGIGNLVSAIATTVRSAHQGNNGRGLSEMIRDIVRDYFQYHSPATPVTPVQTITPGDNQSPPASRELAASVELPKVGNDYYSSPQEDKAAKEKSDQSSWNASYKLPASASQDSNNSTVNRGNDVRPGDHQDDSTTNGKQLTTNQNTKSPVPNQPVAKERSGSKGVKSQSEFQSPLTPKGHTSHNAIPKAIAAAANSSAPSRGMPPGIAFDAQAHSNKPEHVNDVAPENVSRGAVDVQAPNDANIADVPDGSVSDMSPSAYSGADADALTADGETAENDTRSSLAVATPGDYLSVSLVSLAGSQELAPVGAGELVDLAAFPELAEVAAMVEYLEQVIEWAGAEEARSWLPWLIGAGLTAAAAEIARRQLRHREEDEASPYRELLAAGQLV